MHKSLLQGIGIDVVSIARMGQSISKAHFVQRVFSAEERALLEDKGASAPQSAAACFAAKEAFLKATGAGLGGFALCEIAALRHKSGAPYYAFSGKAAVYMQEHGLAAHLSLSHEDGLAFAFCILQQFQ